jgi:outer membrane protein OmpA-like peptidoglycan-associated protein
MKETFDPNRPYNRTEINKVFERTKAKMHLEAIERGQAKYGDNRALYTDGYTGEELRGGDEYEYDHARSAEEIHTKYKATHSDKEIAQIVNHPSNIIVTKTEINRFKGNKRFEKKLKNKIRVKELGINKGVTKKALILADIKMGIVANKLIGGFFNIIYASFKSLMLLLITFWKLIIIVILIILLFLLIPKLMDCYNNYQTDVIHDNKTELNEVETEPIIDSTVKGIVSEKTLRFAKPLDDLTKSITDISEFNRIVRNENIIPVIGSIFKYNSTEISTDGKNVLKGFVENYNKLENKYSILIEGFTCTIGSIEYNRKLGAKRANNIKTELVSLGIPDNLVNIKPIGKQNFVSTNNAKNDLVINRRSNVTIINAQ